MKSIYKILPIFFAALGFFTACEDDPEVGTPLFSEEEDFIGPKVYINEKGMPANSKIQQIIETPIEIIVEENVDSFYIYSTLPAVDDIKVTVREDSQVASAFEKDCPILGAGVVELLESTVVIPKGQKVSSTAIKYSLKNSEELKSFEGKALVALSISEVDGYAAVGKNNNAFYLYINKVVDNIKDDVDFSENTMIPVDSYRIFNELGEDKIYNVPIWQQVGDNNEWTSYQTKRGGGSLTIDFGKTRDFIGLLYAYGSNRPQFMPKEVEVFTSDDGIEFESQGLYILSDIPNSRNDLGQIQFYSPLSCKFVKLDLRVSFSTPESYYDKPCICELRLYEK